MSSIGPAGVTITNSKRPRNEDRDHPQPPPPKRNIPVSLGKPSLRLRLEAYYSLIAPETIADEASWRKRFEQIYDKFGGTVEGEAKLAAKLAKKYGTNVRLLLTTTAAAASSTATSGNGTNTSINTPSDAQSHATASNRSEEWYELTASEYNSGDISFVSSSFDPYAALSADMSDVLKANPFVAQAPMIDNVSKFRRLLPREDPQHLLPSKRSAAAAAATRAQQKAKAASGTSAAATHKIAIPGAFTALADRFDKGPFALLRDIHTKKQRVRVMVRYVDCVRGTLTGYVLAFDKHFNMILRDVDEMYSGRATKAGATDEKNGGIGIDGKLSNVEVEVKRRTCFVGGSGGGRKSNTNANNDNGVLLKRRHIQQMLVRGDCVVVIWRADEERSAYPPASDSNNSAAPKGGGMPSAGALLAARAWSATGKEELRYRNDKRLH